MEVEAIGLAQSGRRPEELLDRQVRTHQAHVKGPRLAMRQNPLHRGPHCRESVWLGREWEAIVTHRRVINGPSVGTTGVLDPVRCVVVHEGPEGMERRGGAQLLALRLEDRIGHLLAMEAHHVQVGALGQHRLRALRAVVDDMLAVRVERHVGHDGAHDLRILGGEGACAARRGTHL